MPVLTRISNPFVTVDVSSLGAEMQSLTSSDGRSWLWNGDPAYWSGRSPLLFPIVGKAPDNRVSIEGKSFEMGQHGFARRSEFTLSASNDTMCRFDLKASETSRAIYPFEFHLSQTHSLDDRTLIVSTEVRNDDARPMPFGLGYHPAFLWPLPGADGKPHRISLDNGADPLLARLHDGLLSSDRLTSPFKGGSLILDPADFAADAMVFPEGAGNGLTYGVGAGAQLKFSFVNLPNLALWQKPGAPFICIEPWHGMAADYGASNDLALRPFTLTLPPGEKAYFAFTVELPG